MQNSYWKDKVEQFKILNKTNNHKICFAGDSFFDRLQLDEFFAEYDVYNRSIGNEYTGTLLNRYESTILNSNPDVVFLYIGGNDIAHGRTKDEITKNIKAIIDKTHQRQIQLKIISILPRGMKYKPQKRNVLQLNQNIVSLNKLIKKLCKENNITSLNVYPEFIDEKGFLKQELTNDGIHLNGDGYTIFTNMLKPFLDRGYKR